MGIYCTLEASDATFFSYRVHMISLNEEAFVNYCAWQNH